MMVTTMLTASAAFAAGPSTILLEGAIHSQGGGPAADGNYNLTFAIYDKQTGGAAAWTEGPISVAAAGGRFSYALGTKSAIDAGKLAALTAQWLGIKVGTDPELPRTAIHATAFALHAGTAAGLACEGCVGADAVANGSVSALKVNFAYAAAANGIKGGDAKAAQALNCTGCVTVAHMKFDKPVDLGSNPLSAGKITSSGDILAKGTVAATTFTGDGSGLTGIKVPSGDCAAGSVVTGITSEGKLKCAKVGGALDAVSGGNMDNHFDDIIHGDNRGTAIPDFDSNGLVATLTMPDIGTALALDIYVEISKLPADDVNPADGKPDNDPTDLAVFLFPPTTTNWPSKPSVMVNDFLKKPKVDGSVYPHYVLHQNTGAGLGALIRTYPSVDKIAAGDLSTWIGKNPKGKWRLLILDNRDRTDKDGKPVAVDGKLVDWYIKVKTVSGQQVAVKGDSFTNGKQWGTYQGHDGGDLGAPVQIGGGLKLGTVKTKCDKTLAGVLQWVAGQGVMVCDGTDWSPALAKPIVFQGGCNTNGGNSSGRYRCINSVSVNTRPDIFKLDSKSGTISTSNAYGRLYVHKTGWYDVNIMNYGAFRGMRAGLYISGTEVAHWRIDDNGGGARNVNVSGSKLVYVNAGDYLNVYIYGWSSNSTLWHAGTWAKNGKTYMRHNWLSVRYVGGDGTY